MPHKGGYPGGTPIIRGSCLKSASAAVAGRTIAGILLARLQAAALARHEWTRYRLIAEDGTPKRLLRLMVNVEGAREFRLLTGDGRLLERMFTSAI